MIKIAKAKKKTEVMDDMKILSKIRSALMNDSVAKDLCEENDIGDWFLKSVPIKFDKLDVSARTVDGCITISKELNSRPFNIIMRYVIHELVHAIQHALGTGKGASGKSKNYLNNKDEIEAFQYQIVYDEKERGLDDVEEYVDELLDYHDYPKKKRKDKKEKLLEKIK